MCIRDRTCTVAYSVGAGRPLVRNVSLNGDDHCYRYLAPPTFGPGPTGQPATFEPATGTFEPVTGTFEPVTATFEPATEELDYCCGSWGTYLTEDDQNAGTVTSVLSVVACTNYTARVQIQLRYVPPDKRQDHSNPPKTSLL